MTAQRRLATATSTGLITVLALSTIAWGHGGDPGSPRVDLHVGKSYDSCYFDLHPELTAGELREFAAEGGQIIRSRQLSSAKTLGAGVLDLGLGYAYFVFDDTKGAWNNTMTHPTADHYLGPQLGVPYLELRVGVADRVDLEAYGTVNWTSNYGFVGLASKIRLLEEGDRMPLSLAVRPSLSALAGPSEVQVYNTSADIAVSRSFAGLAPFAGITFSSTLVIESSSDTDVGHQAAARSLAFAGLEYRRGFFSAAAQAEFSDVTAYALRVGGSF